jgi:hypothetical protein
MMASWVRIFLANKAKLKDVPNPHTAKSVALDVHAFIGCMTTHLMTLYKSLNTEEGIADCMTALVEALFPAIGPYVLESFVDTYKSENRQYNDKMEKLRRLPLDEQVSYKEPRVYLQ